MFKQDFFRRCRACSAYLDDKSEDRGISETVFGGTLEALQTR